MIRRLRRLAGGDDKEGEYRTVRPEVSDEWLKHEGKVREVGRRFLPAVRHAFIR